MTTLGGVIPGVSFLHFTGYSIVNAHEKPRPFSAACGDDPPTITDGYAKWTVIDRPLRQGVTIPTGFNPAKVKVSVRFGVWDGLFGYEGWDTSPRAALHNEEQIDTLHWMAGGNFEGGPSPIVYMHAYTPNLGESYLNPHPYWGVGWVIDGGVEWGKSLRNPQNGCRIYQEASFSLMGFLGVNVGTPKDKSTPGGFGAANTGRYFRTTAATHTAQKIAAKFVPGGFQDVLASQILSDPQNNPCRGSRISLSRKSTRWPMPSGLQVWVPAHVP